MKQKDYLEDNINEKSEQEKHDTIVDGVSNGKKTESGNFRHNDDGTFASRKGVYGKKIDCIPLNKKNVKRDEANQIVYDLAENKKLTKIPKTLEEAYELFELSCSIEHETQASENKYDDEFVQPYTQKYIIKHLIKKYWDIGIPCAILYNPYNKHDIQGCDYWIAYAKELKFNAKKGIFEWLGGDFDVQSIDQKTSLGNSHRLIISKKQRDKENTVKGFFVNELKTNDYILFTNIDSTIRGKKTLGEYDYHKIDGTANLFMAKKDFEQEIMKNCGFDGDKNEFFNYLYDNIAPKLTKLLKEGVNEFSEDDNAVVVTKKNGKKEARIKIGAYYVKARETEQQTEVFLDFNDMVQNLGPKYKGNKSSESYYFKEEGGSNDFVKSQVNEDTKNEVKKTLQNKDINKLFGF